MFQVECGLKQAVRLQAFAALLFHMILASGGSGLVLPTLSPTLQCRSDLKIHSTIPQSLQALLRAHTASQASRLSPVGSRHRKTAGGVVCQSDPKEHPAGLPGSQNPGLV